MTDVLIIMGSLSDKEKVRPCADILENLNISWKMLVSSAHRSPERTIKIVKEAEKAGTKIFICAAGMAAHLAGAVAAHTICPVIGIPLSASSLSGMDSLFSTVQMPSGFPVATVALDKAGAKNAAWLAAEILALQNPDLKNKLIESRKQMLEEITEASDSLEKEQGNM